jgi:hypothetical protein
MRRDRGRLNGGAITYAPDTLRDGDSYIIAPRPEDYERLRWLPVVDKPPKYIPDGYHYERRAPVEEDGVITWQYVLVKDLCGNILNHGYCIYPRNFDYDEHKEYGTVGKWINENLDDLHKRMGSNLDGDGPGGLRKIPQESLDQLKKIFDITGATELMNKVIDDAHLQAEKENLSDEDYFKKVYITNNSSKHLNNG